MRSRSFLFACFVLILASCQDKYLTDPTSNGSGGGSSAVSGPLLSGLVQIFGLDTATSTYSYNTSGKLIKRAATIKYPHQTLFNSFEFNRDNNNNIVSYVFNMNVPGYVINNAVYTCHYQAGSKLFDYAIGKYIFNGINWIDSVVFENNNGSISIVRMYRRGGSDTYYQSEARTEYGYDGNSNITSLKSYGSSGSMTYSYTFQYDNKVNAMQYGQEGLLFGAMQAGYENLLFDGRFLGKNNIVKSLYTFLTGPSTSVLMTTDYTITYNSDRRPASITGNSTPSAGQIATTFTY